MSSNTSPSDSWSVGSSTVFFFEKLSLRPEIVCLYFAINEQVRVSDGLYEVRDGEIAGHHITCTRDRRNLIKGFVSTD